MGDANNTILEDYIKKGLERGFNINYIKETLISHGHNPDKVNVAASNIMGMKVPEQLKGHLDSERPKQKSYVVSKVLIILIVILLIICCVFTFKFFSDRQKINAAQGDLEELEQMGIDIDDLSSEIQAQQKLVKDKDLTISEREALIEEQIKLIDEANEKLEEQRVGINEVLLDLLNRMIGRINEQ